MTSQAYPALNDIEPSWADIAVTATVTGGALVDMADIAAIKFTDKLEVGTREGTSGGRVMARTTGKVSYEASVTFYRSGFRRFLKALMENAPTRGNQLRVGLVGFDIMIQHTPPGEDEIYQTKIKGCRYLGGSDDMKEGTDADKIEVTISTIEIVRIIDGKEVLLV